MAKIDELGFGRIAVEGRKIRKRRQDVLVPAEGTVRKRRGGFLMFGSDTVTRKELEDLSRGQFDIIIIGTRTHGGADISPSSWQWPLPRCLCSP